MPIFLAADVGGTKVNVRLVKSDETSTQQSLMDSVLFKQRYLCRDFEGLTSLLEQFIADAKAELPHIGRPEKACIAIAGPVINNNCQMPNLPWYVEGDELQRVLQIPRVKLINDFAVIGYAIKGLPDKDLVQLHPGKPQKNSVVAFMGAGTGLGEGFSTFHAGSYEHFSTEGSDANFAPYNEEEWQLLQYLQDQLGTEHVTYENVVSGSGIVSIYRYLRDHSFAPESKSLQQAVKTWENTPPGERESDMDPAPLITQAAMEKSDRLCEKTMSMFLAAYGSEAGNFALKTFPFSGLYLAGGVSAKILPLLQDGKFIKHFLAKGRMRPVLEQIPVYVITNEEVGAMGATLCAAKL